MQVANTEPGAFDMDGQEDLAPTGEVLDVAIPTELGSTGDRASPVFTHSLLDLFAARSSMCASWLRRQGDNAL